MDFATWIDTFVEEKGFNTEYCFEVEGESGDNVIPFECVIEAMKGAAESEQAAIKAMVVKIDFANGNAMDFFGHMAKAMAI